MLLHPACHLLCFEKSHLPTHVGESPREVVTHKHCLLSIISMVSHRRMQKFAFVDLTLGTVYIFFWRGRKEFDHEESAGRHFTLRARTRPDICIDV